jgi:RNA polymerase sigma-70 factor (ECF subfamily)
MSVRINVQMAMAVVSRLAGDAAKEGLSFPALLRAHQGMVFSIALHFLRDRAVAEEIAQDVFLELHRHLATLESEAHVVFWLRKVTSRRCIDAVRRHKHRAAVALENAPEPAARETPADPLLSRMLQQLIGALPEKPRMVMVLRYQEELMPEEIAEVLGMPVSTVKGHLHRSLAVLREKFERKQGSSRHG